MSRAGGKKNKNLETRMGCRHVVQLLDVFERMKLNNNDLKGFHGWSTDGFS